MANIFDYLKDVAYDSYYDLPLNELDILALTETTYLSFDNLVSTSPQRLLDLAPQVPREPNMLTSKNRLQLLDELAQHKRFKNCKLSHFINDIDPELQKQFATMIYRLTLDTYLIVFRGTDDSIIGWKEDFHLTYMKEIPAQKHALRYLKNFLPTILSKRSFWLGIPREEIYPSMLLVKLSKACRIKSQQFMPLMRLVSTKN